MLVLVAVLCLMFGIMWAWSYSIYEPHYRHELKDKPFKLFMFNTLTLWGTGTIICACLIFIIGLGCVISYVPKVDERIAIYKEENARIEESIATLVEDYMEYELGVVKDCKPDSATTLVTMYPDLASSTLVAKQIETYNTNSTQIKHLECERLTQEYILWWIYFK